MGHSFTTSVGDGPRAARHTHTHSSKCIFLKVYPGLGFRSQHVHLLHSFYYKSMRLTGAASPGPAGVGTEPKEQLTSRPNQHLCI